MAKGPENDTPEAILDRFLEVELLHSLGCYTNARVRSKKIKNSEKLGCGKALKRTYKLNRVLDKERDDPKQQWRHPGPARGKGLLLDDRDDAPDRLRLITDFYNVGRVALEQLHTPNPEKIPATKTEDASLEKLGSCLFWERDPGSAVHGVNGDFYLLQSELDAIRRGGKGRVPHNTPRVKRRIETKKARFSDRQNEVEAALKPRLTYKRAWNRERARRTARTLCNLNLLSEPSGDELTPGFVIECLVAAHLRLHYVEHFLAAPFKKAVGMGEADRKDALRRLREAEALNTFVYVACWSIPWLFAKDDDEMHAVLDGCALGFDHGKRDRDVVLEPDARTVKESDKKVFPALWRAQRLAILALHRRAFGHSLRDALVEEAFNDTSFKDFHKLQRLLRVQMRELPENMPSTEGEDHPKVSPSAFIAGMDALAETHIGDLYRSDHAHPVALEHFCDAQDRLDQLSDELLRSEEARELLGEGDSVEVTKEADASRPLSERPTEGPEGVAELLRDSRWRIHLMLSKGKGFYEAGKLKRSVKWLLKSWSALLSLVDFYEEKQGKVEIRDDPDMKETFKRLENAIETLKKIRNDPDFSKSELKKKVQGIVEDAVKAKIPLELRVIAAEILLRLGHVLFILQLDAPPEDEARLLGEKGGEPDQLASSCLERAHELDEFSTLVAGDRLKIEYKRKRTAKRASLENTALSDPDLQWPYGRGNPDQIIRMIEYHLLWWLVMTELVETAQATEAAEIPEQVEPSNPNRKIDLQAADRDANRNVARELIAGLLTHTDSINVRQSQVYRYLMQPKRPARRIGPAEGWEEPPRGQIGGSEATAIEFICLRRYSSFFPFVPRPSAFRSLGGGYLLRLHHEDDGCPQPFGIAVDPGPDFIENLYRCGFGLGDINMIILTHDHPDHSVDLDPILSLLGYRMKQGDPTFQAPDNKGGEVRRLLIVGNESVTRQLSFFNKPHVSAPGASRPPRRDAVQVVSFDEFESFRKKASQMRIPEVAIPDELQLKPVVSIRHLDAYGMLAYGFRLSLGDDGPSIGFTGDTGGFLLEQEEGFVGPGEETSRRWTIKPNDEHKTMELTGDRTWREHWEDVLGADVLVAHVSGLPLSQLLMLANGGDLEFSELDPELQKLLSEAWDGLEENVRKQVSFAFWLPDKAGITSLPLEEIDKEYKWPRGHLYLIGLLEFARGYRKARRYIDKPGLFLVGELREELGSLRSKIAASLNKGIFESAEPASGFEAEPDCSALTADIGLRLMISREKGEAKVRVLCSTCDLDNDRTREERFHDPREIREVCVKGENEGMFYNCSNHDPSHHRDPVFLERVERYDVFASMPLH